MANDDSDEPVLHRNPMQGADKLATQFMNKADKFQAQKDARHPEKKRSDSDDNGPPGGFDDTPIPRTPPGYTLKITFHRAENLPFADINTFSSDPYVHAVLRTGLPKRHKQDPDLFIRTPTVHRNTDPTWNAEWIVANVPASGFFLKCRLYDEDPADHDDRLGNAHVIVDRIGDGWKGFKEQKFEIKKRMGSWRAYSLRGCAALMSKRVKMGGDIIVSIENLGRTPGDNGGRAYTVGPLAWTRHNSPLIGRLTGVKDRPGSKDEKKGTERYDFQAVQMQLQGPVPDELYHRYVELKSFVAGMFTGHSFRGRILNHALHHQHARLYNYDRSTVYGVYQEPCIEMTKHFLELVHYDQGGRLFTYVLTLDGQWRFTETGKEFGIDLLSKHTMHSDVSIYIAFSGEFFVRRLKHPHKNKSKSPDPGSEALPPAPESDEEDESPQPAEPSKDPNMYELVIDNDSGTYRPKAEKLSLLKKFMSSNLPGLRVVTLDCQADEEKMTKLKDEQRQKKKQAGSEVTYLQNSSMSSISSSDEEELEDRAAGLEHENKYKRRIHKLQGHGQDLHHGNRNVTEEDSNATEITNEKGSPFSAQNDKSQPQEGDAHPQLDAGPSEKLSEKTEGQVNGNVARHQQESVQT